MNQKLCLIQFRGFIFSSLLGIIFHYLFKITDNSIFIALFCPVNESVWEHLKLLIFPMLIYSYIERHFMNISQNSFWSVKLTGTIMSILLTPILYYTLNGAFGNLPDFVNIIIFFITLFASYLLESVLFNKNYKYLNNRYSKCLLFCIIIGFMFFTFITPRLPIFLDPLTNTYGFFQLK